MTAANVATTPRIGRTAGPGAVGAIALTVGLLAGIATGALALRPATATDQAVAPAGVGPTTYQPRVGPMAGSAAIAPATSAMTTYAQVVSNLQAAESRHDFAARARFERQLSRTLTGPTIGSIYQEHTRILKNLAAAEANGDGLQVARSRQALNALCGSASVRAQLSFCN